MPTDCAAGGKKERRASKEISLFASNIAKSGTMITRLLEGLLQNYYNNPLISLTFVQCQHIYTPTRTAINSFLRMMQDCCNNPVTIF